MIRDLFRAALSGMALSLVANYRRVSVQLLRIEAAKWYVHGVRMARLSAVGLIGLGLMIGLIVVGVLLFHAGLFILLPCTLKTKAVLGLLLGLAYAILGGLALRAAVNERTWMAKSGAAGMLEKALAQNRKD